MSIETLASGELISGITLTLTSQVLWAHGVHFDVFNDFKRQTLLNFLMLLAAINGVIAYAFNASLTVAITTTQPLLSVWASNITTIISFVLVQYGLVMINHNSLARLNTYCQLFNRKTLNRISGTLYFLPIFAMIPVYQAIKEKVPQGLLLNSAACNCTVFKPMSIAFIIITEVIATITDIGLLSNVFAIKNQLDNCNPSDKKRENMQSISLDLIVNYIMTWFFLCFDLMVKILLMFGYHFLFDSIISSCTIALRARSNIFFGLNLKHIFDTKGSSLVSYETPPINSVRNVEDGLVRRV